MGADGLLERPFGLFFGGVSEHMSSGKIDRVLHRAFGNVSQKVRERYVEGSGFERHDSALIAAYRDSCVICPSVTQARQAVKANISVYFYTWGAIGKGLRQNILYGPD